MAGRKTWLSTTSPMNGASHVKSEVCQKDQNKVCPGCTGGVLQTIGGGVIQISSRQARSIDIATELFSQEHAGASHVCFEEVHYLSVLHGNRGHGSDPKLEGGQ